MHMDQRGKRLFADKAGFKRRIYIIRALNEGQVKASQVIEGYWNRELFEAYVENLIILILKPEKTIILDDARFHRSERKKDLIENVGCKIWFLPPYSPDLNPIEHF